MKAPPSKSNVGIWVQECISNSVGPLDDEVKRKIRAWGAGRGCGDETRGLGLGEKYQGASSRTTCFPRFE